VLKCTCWLAHASLRVTDSTRTSVWPLMKFDTEKFLPKPVYTFQLLLQSDSSNSYCTCFSVCLKVFSDIRGLPIKIADNLSKLLSHLLWSYWALSPSLYSSLLFIYRLQHFFQFWKHLWNASLGMLRDSASKFSFISLTDSDCHTFSTDFSLVKRKKSAGARSGEHGVWGTIFISCFMRKS